MTERRTPNVRGTQGATLSDSDIGALLSAVDAHPTIAAYVRVARALRGASNALVPIRIALLSSFTANGLVPYLVVECAREGFAADVHVGAFNSVLQELLDPNSATANARPDVVIVAQQLEDINPSLSYNFLSGGPAQHVAMGSDLVRELHDAMVAFRRRHRSAFVVHNFVRGAAPLLGLAEHMALHSQSRTVRTINDALVAAVRDMSDAIVMDFDLVCSTVGLARARDSRGWYLGRAPFSAAVLPSLGREHARIIRALRSAPRKCLVLDLDNTLWGGLAGEDGVAGIRIGHAYPGNVFLDFQRALLQLHQRGVLLAINSSNNAADIAEVFRARPEMALAPEHFAATRINWLDKPGNMVSIADELNIGLDALVFFDDSPVERALMHEVLPEVLTLDVPENPIQYTELLERSRPFDRLGYTDEDRRRGAMQLRRAGEARSPSTLQDFLNGLEMRAEVTRTVAADIPRAADLLRKTNQFNLTTRRYSAADVDAMLADGVIGVFSLRVSDRFDDYGLVGVALVRRDGDAATVDDFVLSCRVIGRGAESALLAELAEWARADGATLLVGEFIPTAKNQPAAELYATHGFVRQPSRHETTLWHLDLRGALPRWPEHIVRVGTISLMESTARQDALPRRALAQ